MEGQLRDEEKELLRAARGELEEALADALVKIRAARNDLLGDASREMLDAIAAAVMDRFAERLLNDGGILDRLTAKLAADGGLLYRVEHLEQVAGSVVTRTEDRATVDILVAFAVLAALVVALIAYVAWMRGNNHGVAMARTMKR